MAIRYTLTCITVNLSENKNFNLIYQKKNNINHLANLRPDILNALHCDCA